MTGDQRDAPSSHRADDVPLEYRSFEDDVVGVSATMSDKPGFASAVVDERARTLLLWWKGPVPSGVRERVLAMQARHGSASVSLHEADYSEQELVAEAERMSNKKDTSAGRSYYFAASPEHDASGVKIEVEPGSDLLHLSPTQLQQRFGAAMPVRAEETNGASNGWVWMTGEAVSDRE